MIEELLRMDKWIYAQELGHLETDADMSLIGPKRQQGKKAVVKKGRKMDPLNRWIPKDHEGQVIDERPHHEQADRVIAQMSNAVFNLAGPEVNREQVRVLGKWMFDLPTQKPLLPFLKFSKKPIVGKKGADTFPDIPDLFHTTTDLGDGSYDWNEVNQDDEP